MTLLDRERRCTRMASKPLSASNGVVPEEAEPTLHPDDDCAGGGVVGAAAASEPGAPGGITHLPVETSQ